MKAIVIICLLFISINCFSQEIRNSNSRYQPIAFEEKSTYLLTSPLSVVNVNHPNVLIVMKSNIELNIDPMLQNSRIQLVQDSVGGYCLSCVVCGDLKCTFEFISSKAVGDTTTLFFYRENENLIIQKI